MERHFTATVYIVHGEKVLLLLHPKIGKWLPPGGHVEPNETPPAAARREVLEETGLTFSFVRDENIWINQWNATSFERPYLCLLEKVPAHNGVPAHEHMDFIYVGKPVGNTVPSSADPIRWFAAPEIEALKEEVEIFGDTKEMIYSLLPSQVSL